MQHRYSFRSNEVKLLKIVCQSTCTHRRKDIRSSHKEAEDLDSSQPLDWAQSQQIASQGRSIPNRDIYNIHRRTIEDWPWDLLPILVLHRLTVCQEQH